MCARPLRYACATAPLQLVSLDLMPGWRPYVEGMGMMFGEWDITGPEPLTTKAASLNQGKGVFPAFGVTYVIISYVMIYVSTDEVCEMLRDLLVSGQAYCIIVSERSMETVSVKMMEKLGIQVHRLIEGQDICVDERQSMWLSPSTKLTPSPASRGIPTFFPNQPFEEKKDKMTNRPH